MKKLLNKIFNLLINFIIFFISFKKIQILFDIILHFSLKAKGFKNFGSFDLSGEELFLNKIKKYDLDYSLDVGAHNGNFSEKIIKITKSKVISFEPSIDSFKKLNRLKKKYPKKIFTYNFALSDVNEKLNFYTVGKESQLASFEKNIRKFSYIDRKKIKVKKIKCKKGDNFIKKINLKGSIDYIKIDTEGYDYKVLNGLIKTITKHKTKFIQFEMNWHYVFSGYNVFKISSQFKDYNIYRMLPYKSGLIKIDPSHPNNNFFHLSNYVLIRKEIKIN